MTKRPKASEIELHPDAWLRFERFIRDVAKAGPQHRKPAGKPKGKPSKRSAKKSRR
jgi:hypothetical protein